MAYQSRTAYAARPGTGRQMYSPSGHVKLNGLEAIRRSAAAATRKTSYTFHGLGYPSFVTAAIAQKQTLGAVQRSPIGGRYRMRGLGDCSVIDPVTGGRVSYQTGDPHCGATPPPPGGGGGGGGNGLPTCPTGYVLNAAASACCGVIGTYPNGQPIMKCTPVTPTQKQPPYCSDGLAPGTVCLDQAGNLTTMPQAGPKLPQCSDTTLAPGTVCLNSNGGQQVVPWPAPAPTPAPTPTPITCPAPLVLDPTGTYCMQTALTAATTTSSWTDSITNFVNQVPGRWAGVGVGAVVLYMLFFNKKR
ncbi:MAG TPA: hypothetical protein VFA71_03855 [Terriglobales bacterium]|nr:hypothetical protein [Terriglobales bacterium]